MRRLASGLHGLGVKPGENIAILANNSHRYCETYFVADIAGTPLAMLTEAERQPVRAYETLRLYWQLDADQQIRRFHRHLAPSLIRLALTLDHPEVATAVDAVEEAAALATDVPSMRAVARRCRGLVGGDPKTMLEAVELVQLGPRVLDQVATLEDAARVLASAGRTTEAQPLLLGALELCDQLAATAWAVRVRAALHRELPHSGDQLWQTAPGVISPSSLLRRRS